MKKRILYIVLISTSLIIVFAGGRAIFIADLDSSDIVLVQQDDAIASKDTLILTVGNSIGFIHPEFHIAYILLVISLILGVLVLTETLFVNIAPARAPPVR